ncbi:putative VQ motif-containing protein motif-containing protein [Forsythia ovata]|uniref:VQ motif-containing protein motif-containing protein n=1 Tax=Forsythia ovata TaxID=205694 RepID=A0ABD1PK70_9LAMI
MSTPSALKIKKASHFIKKSPESFNGTSKPQPRQPVIIYTYSPKIIHTNPRDFMTLVQKLTGLSHSNDDQYSPTPKPETSTDNSNENESPLDGVMDGNGNENDSSNGQVYSNCFDPQIIYPSNYICFNTVGNTTDFLYSTAPFYNYIDLSSPLDDIQEIREF